MVVLALAGAAAAQDQRLQDMMQDSIRARQLSQAFVMYAQDHEGELPPDLSSTLDYLGPNNADQASRVKNIKNALIAPGVPSQAVPADAKAEWVNEHSSYVYLGGPGLKMEEVPGWEDLVIAHLRLDTAHPSGANPPDPASDMVSLAYIDGHVSMTMRAEAERQIKESKLVLDALRTGGPMPDDRQAVWDLQKIAESLQAYAKAHKDELPPDLGSALEYVKPDKRRLATPAQRAGIFLSPMARRNTHVPEAPTAEWVTRNTSYVYLGGADGTADKPLLKSRIEVPYRTILVYGRPDWAMNVVRSGMEASVVPVSTSGGGAVIMDKRFVEAMAPESKKVIGFVRRGTPMPDYDHASRDLRLLLNAVKAYAAANNGDLPKDLGSTLKYLPEDELPTPADKARVYLSPRVERMAHVPDEVTADWVNKNANYVYLCAGEKPLKKSDFFKEGSQVSIILYPPLDEAGEVLFDFEREPPFKHRAFPAAYWGGVMHVFPESDEIEKAKKAIEAVRGR
jgi:hypothetical protein